MEQNNLKVKVKAQRRQELEEEASRLRERLPVQMQRVMDCAREKGALNWLTALPLEELGFSLHKGAFHDSLCLCYGWQPPYMPSNCVCGKQQTVEHALSCSHGGFPALRHNDIRDITAKCLSEVCHNVAVEPELQPLTGESLQLRTANSEKGAQLNVSAQGFGGEASACIL